MGTKYEMPEPESKAEARAPDGAAPDLFAGNDLFADVECPLKNIPAIQLISTQRPTTSPWLMTCHPLLDIRGPENWPDDTPMNDMTATSPGPRWVSSQKIVGENEFVGILECGEGVGLELCSS